MQDGNKELPAGGIFLLLTVLLNAIVLKHGFITHTGWYAMFPVTLVLLAFSIIIFKRKQW